MSAKPYLTISGSVFGLVAILHFLRLIYALPVYFGNWPAPMWVSVLGGLLAAVLSVWGYKLAFKRVPVSH